MISQRIQFWSTCNRVPKWCHKNEFAQIMGLFVFSIIQNNLPEKKSSHTKNGSSEFRVSNNRDMGFVSSYFSILDSYLCWILQLDPVIHKRSLRDCGTSNFSIFTFSSTSNLKVCIRSYSNCFYLMMRFWGSDGKVCKMMTSHYGTLLGKSDGKNF